MTVADPPVVSTEHIVATYDALAERYDARFGTARYRAEDQLVARWLDGPHLEAETVLDIGCGTGLLLDLLGTRITPSRYLGVDPSAGMLTEHAAKHPLYARADQTLQDWLADNRLAGVGAFDRVVALYGVASYLDSATVNALPSLLTPSGMGLIMFYRPGYVPDFHDGPIISPDLATIHLPGMATTDWSDFTVVTFHA